MQPGPPVPALTEPAFLTPTDLLTGALSEVTTFFANNLDYLTEVCVAASQEVEESCDRRLLPFVDVVETDVLTGVDSGSGSGGDTEALFGLTAALGLSEARAYGATAFCRDLWLAHYPPRRTELWTYTACTVSLTWPWGATAVLAPGSFTGPQPDTGHVRLNIGVLAPPGTEYTATYSGGYLYGVPHPLKEAARWSAIRRLILEVEPEQRQGMSLAEVDEEITRNLAGYARI